jgi:hypothetical protein
MTARPLSILTVALAAVAMLTTTLTRADPPELTQWQRDIEKDRVNEALAEGNFDKALILANQLLKDYKRAIYRNTAGRRPRGGDPSLLKAQPELIQLTFILATTERMIGDPKRARLLFESLEEDVTALEMRLRAESRVLEYRENQFDQAFLAAIDNYESTRGTDRVQRLVNTAAISGAVSAMSDRAADSLATIVAFHARLYDEFGAMELEAGRNRHAESLFRKSTAYYSYFRSTQETGTSRAKHLRNYARLYIKDAEELLRMSNTDEADAALDRAEIYLDKARIAVHSQPTVASSTSTPDLPNEHIESSEGWETADLWHQFAEYFSARADQAGAVDPVSALDYLCKAENAAIHAIDQLLRLVPDHHPFTVFCFAELAGINARRVIYSEGTQIPTWTRQSFAIDMRNYWRRAQDVATKTVKAKENPVFRMLDAERAVCRKAQEFAKKIKDASPFDRDSSDEFDGDADGSFFPSIGSRVRRGPDWSRVWADADGGEDEASIGTVVRVDDDGWLVVKWDRTSREIAHRPGGPGRMDLQDLDGNTSSPRPPAVDLSEGDGRSIGSPQPGAVGAPPGFFGPGRPSGVAPPGYGVPGGSTAQPGRFFPSSNTPPASSTPPGYGPPGSGPADLRITSPQPGSVPPNGSDRTGQSGDAQSVPVSPVAPEPN